MSKFLFTCKLSGDRLAAVVVKGLAAGSLAGLVACGPGQATQGVAGSPAASSGTAAQPSAASASRASVPASLPQVTTADICSKGAPVIYRYFGEVAGFGEELLASSQVCHVSGYNALGDKETASVTWSTTNSPISNGYSDFDIQCAILARQVADNSKFREGFRLANSHTPVDGMPAGETIDNGYYGVDVINGDKIIDITISFMPATGAPSNLKDVGLKAASALVPYLESLR